MRKYILLFIMVFVISGCMEKTYTGEENEHIKIIKNEIDVYDDIKILDLLQIDNNYIENLSDNYEIKTDKLGKKSYDFYYRFEGKKYDIEVTVDVLDREKPRTFSGTNKTLNVGYDGNLCDLIRYGDNYDREVKCVIEGNYDFNKVGTYNITYVLTDNSENENKIKANLNIITPSKSSSDKKTTKKKSFTEILNDYKEDNIEYGIDVSKWQGEIDFNKVKNAGASFVMIRIGVQKSAGKELEIDPYYEQNIKNAKEAGLKVGVYLYSIATSEKEGIKHAKWVIDKLNGEKLDLPVVFDWENWSKWNEYKMSFHDINEIFNKFVTTIEEANYEGMLYSSKYYLENIWDNKNKHKVWLAHYIDKTTYEGDYTMWQLSNVGRIDGIYGDVDLNILYKQ